jgi:hypothetical protein
MKKRSRRYEKIKENLDVNKFYVLSEALTLLKENVKKTENIRACFSFN